MANRLRILEASPGGLDAPPPGSLRVALVNMPFSSINFPSIQLGLLQAIVARHGLEAKSHYLNIRFGARIGWDHYEEVCHGFGAYLLGDWIFARAAFGDEAPPAERYLAAFDAEVGEVCARMRCGRDRLMRLREEEAPAFIEACLEEIPWGEYDVIGFSSMFAQHCAVLAMARRIKSRYPKAVIVLGEVNGNVTASEKVDIRDGGSVDGDIISPRVAIAEGAHFRGSVDMQRKGAQPGQQKASSSQQPEKTQTSTPASAQATAAAH